MLWDKAQLQNSVSQLGLILLPKGLLSAESFRGHGLEHPTGMDWPGVLLSILQSTRQPHRQDLSTHNVGSTEGQKRLQRKQRENWASKWGHLVQRHTENKEQVTGAGGPQIPKFFLKNLFNLYWDIAD